jgi:A/G-specific adenine glycosylase
MGYYRRAKNLHAAAKAIVERFEGRVPDNVVDLESLPGVGRYSAGAIASIALGKPVPIVDGNVARVLMRIAGRGFLHGSPEGQAWAWERTERLVASSTGGRAGTSPAALNEGLMELGALICTPKAPRCGECPVRNLCTAAGAGTQNDIPRPKVRANRSKLFCEVVVIRDGRGRILVERRADDGMWAGMWQAPTWERVDGASKDSEVCKWIGVAKVQLTRRFVHHTSHREVWFTVWSARGVRRAKGGRVFMSTDEVLALGLSNPQRRILLEA